MCSLHWEILVLGRLKLCWKAISSKHWPKKYDNADDFSSSALNCQASNKSAVTSAAQCDLTDTTGNEHQNCVMTARPQ
eukprot:scaffold266832_cov27-Prasinocladus_malaysianus.AAC.1